MDQQLFKALENFQQAAYQLKKQWYLSNDSDNSTLERTYTLGEDFQNVADKIDQWVEDVRLLDARTKEAK